MFGERLARWRGLLEISAGQIQHWADIPGRRLRSASWHPTAASVAPANRHPPRAVPHRCRAKARVLKSIWSKRSRPGSQPGIGFGGKPVIHRDEAAARGLRQRRGDTIMGLDPANHATRHGKKQNPANIHFKSLRARRAGTEYRLRGPALRHQCRLHPNHVGACEPHQLRKGPAAVIEGRRRSTVRCGRHYSVEKTLRRWIEGHICSG